MAKIYWRTIKRGTRTLAEVPANLKEEVKVLAKQDVINNVINEDQYKEFIGEDYIV